MKAVANNVQKIIATLRDGNVCSKKEPFLDDTERAKQHCLTARHRRVF